ncbi:t-SNARE family protein [Planoprotostelium fungivorum]|uniref:t-SNARE family protein n=1 Tax=Planoprotostelium fungivorum TaxID=1890364 RepID=A0A2P6N230_9EUKA|nr:t-SNARE family protein [Planoprotostelium fungivorum]PRP84138.1 t-SNARE family protein [Planoprotostelium fungivorum]
MNDRLSELQKTIDPNIIETDKEHKKQKKSKTKRTKSTESEPSPSEDGDFMTSFFSQVGQMKKTITMIEETTRRLQAVTTQTDLSSLSSLLGDTNCSIAQLRDDLLLMGKENTMLGDDPKIARSSEYTIRVNAFYAIKSKFFDAARHYEEAQLRAKNKEEQHAERRIRVVLPHATQDEIEEIVNQGDDIFQQKLMDKRQHQAAVEALTVVETQRQQIHHLEQSIAELHQLFLDMALLVDEQGEMINVIEMNVNKTRQYVIEANHELKLALKYSKSARKKIAVLIVGAVVGVAVGVGGLATKLVGI